MNTVINRNSNPVFHKYCRNYYYLLYELILSTIDQLVTQTDRVYLDIDLHTIIPNKDIYEHNNVPINKLNTSTCKLSNIHYDDYIDDSENVFKKLQLHFYNYKPHIYLIDESTMNSHYNTEIFITKTYQFNRKISHGLNLIPRISKSDSFIEIDISESIIDTQPKINTDGFKIKKIVCPRIQELSVSNVKTHNDGMASLNVYAPNNGLEVINIGTPISCDILYSDISDESSDKN